MKKNLAILILILLYPLLFYNAQAGLNYLCFSLAVIGALVWTNSLLLRRKTLRWVIGGWLLSALAVIVHHSMLSKLVYWSCFVVSWGYLLRQPSRFWFFGLLESLSSFLGGWWQVLWSRFIIQEDSHAFNRLALWRQFRLVMVPSLLLIPFYLLYQQANPNFQRVGTWLSGWFQPLFEVNLSPVFIWYLILGSLLAAATLGERQGNRNLHRLERQWRYKLRRQRRPGNRTFPISGLRIEYRIAIISFGALNALLLLINIIDFTTVWISQQVRTASELSQYVHEGTWLLILSILLAIGVVVVFLRGNLNFYPRARPLKQLIYLWLGQNAFLALSVGVRNWHYIDAYQLAHGRIVVLFFLLLCLYGLYSVYRKVAGPRTTYFLLQFNGWALGVALLLSSAVNWDSFITTYNLRHGSTDYHYLQYSLQNNLVPIIQHLNQMPDEHADWPTSQLKNRCDKVTYNYKTSDWRGWNYSDYRQYQLARAWLGEHSEISSNTNH